ncbi:MAG: hypothetical protein U1F98_15460 [Verrucomicrobiota bacterium]
MNRFPTKSWFRLLLLALTVAAPAIAAGTNPPPDLWPLATNSAAVHRFSTLFTAQDVRDNLNSDAKIQKALDWCKQTGVTRVYIESFRDGYQPDRAVLLKLKNLFATNGFEVSGCITPTHLGKASAGWNVACCFTDLPTQAKLKSEFEFAAGLFDEMMIDDFLFTDCPCPDCNKARLAKTVNVLGKKYPVNGDSWPDYRCELMVRLSRAAILDAARKVNPNARIIIKFPQWYDEFQKSGYDVTRQSADFDRTWVGTETRDSEDKEWGACPPYAAYFIMRWLGGIGGSKCGGGWYDWLGTSQATYVEQARQTILGGAPESMLFAYGGLQGDNGPADVQALRANIPELLAVAREVSRRTATGIAAYRPAGSDAGDEPRLFDFAGMIGLPLAPCHKFPTNAPAAAFSVCSAADPNLAAELAAYIATGKPVLITDGLAQKLKDRVNLAAANVQILAIKGAPRSVLKLNQDQIDTLRTPLLRPFGCTFRAPAKVALYLFTDGSWVVENFNDTAAKATLNGESLALPARAWLCRWK